MDKTPVVITTPDGIVYAEEGDNHAYLVIIMSKNNKEDEIEFEVLVATGANKETVADSLIERGMIVGGVFSIADAFMMHAESTAKQHHHRHYLM